jgi:hypothetical protein
LLCDAYHKWRLLRSAPPVEPFQEPPRGTILSEGAGAILLARSGPVQIEKIAGGTNFRKQREAAAGVDAVFSELCTMPPDLVAASANGTFIDAAEQDAIRKHSPKAKIYAVKGSLGESVGASSLWQTICGTQALSSQRVPGSTGPIPLQTAVVSTCGLNQQVAGLRLTI